MMANGTSSQLTMPLLLQTGSGISPARSMGILLPRCPSRAQTVRLRQSELGSDSGVI